MSGYAPPNIIFTWSYAYLRRIYVQIYYQLHIMHRQENKQSGNKNVLDLPRNLKIQWLKIQQLNAKNIQETKWPPKVRLFLWLVHKRAHLTWPALQQRGWIGSNRHVLCNADEELTNHIMLNCSFTNYIRDKCAETVGVNINRGQYREIWNKVSRGRHRPDLGGTLVATIG